MLMLNAAVNELSFLTLLSSAVGGDAVITCRETRPGRRQQLASWLIVDMYSIMLITLQELLKSCTVSCYCILA